MYVAVKERLLIYSRRTLGLKREIGNYLSEVVGIEPLRTGVLVYGIDQLSRNILLVVSPEHEVVATVSLILNDGKYVKAIKTLPLRHNHTFVCRSERRTTLYELTETF